MLALLSPYPPPCSTRVSSFATSTSPFCGRKVQPNQSSFHGIRLQAAMPIQRLAIGRARAMELKGELLMLRLQRSARNEFKLNEVRQQRPQSPFSWSSSTTKIPISVAASVVPESSSSFCSDKSSPIHALIFDCDGVILESEHLHREAYNKAFIHFDVRCPSSAATPLVWTPEFYDELQNRIGGGKPKMRWYFGEHGWPSSTILSKPPVEDDEKIKLIDTIQDWKTEHYKDTIRSGTVKPRPGVVRLMDSAKAAGIKVAVCSAATKSSVILCLQSLIGIERFQGLDCFLAGGGQRTCCSKSDNFHAGKAINKEYSDKGSSTETVSGIAMQSCGCLPTRLRERELGHCPWNRIRFFQISESIFFLSTLVFLFTGDDVKEKKPDPSIYLAASKRLGVEGNDCLVIEDSVIGLQAATQAGMPCIITYTSSTANQNFEDAIAKYQDLSNVRLEDLESLYTNSTKTN